MDQLIVITKVLGYPEKKDIDFISDEKALDYIKCLPQKNGINFEKKFSKAGKHAIDFLKKCLQFNPNLRISIEEALEHPLFKSIRNSKNENFRAERINLDIEDKNIKSEKDLRNLYIKEIFEKS